MDQLFLDTYKFATLNNFFNGIVHDLNNILMAIVVNTEIIQKTVTSENRMYTNLNNILHASKRARELVTQVQNIDSNVEEKKVPVNLHVFIKDSSSIIRSVLPDSINFQIYSENNIYNIKANPTQIFRLIINLCINARHAINQNKGIVEIYLENKIIDNTSETGLASGQYVQLSIVDDGGGMTEEVKKHIFEPHFTTGHSSNGLGLFIVNEIVNNHGGKIIVDSEPEKGTRFSIYFPEMKSEDANSFDYRMDNIIQDRFERLS